MQKRARISPRLLAALARVGGGAATGGALGYYGTPYVSGYEDVPQARRISALTDALLGAAAGGIAHRGGGYRRTFSRFLRSPAKAQGRLAGKGALAFGLGELIPIQHSLAQKRMDSAEQINEAARNIANSAETTSIPLNIQKAMQSSTVRGAGVGAGLAGLLSILTGLSRRRTEREIRHDSSRGGMVGSDFLKYLIPALVAGGVTGSLTKKQD